MSADPAHPRTVNEAAERRRVRAAGDAGVVQRGGAGHLDLDALGRALDGAAWSPLQLATRGRRPVSPRLPHAVLLHLAHEARRAAGDGAVAVGTEGLGVAPDPVRLAALTAASEDVIPALLDALGRAGVVRWTVVPGEGAPRLVFPPTLLGAPPRVGAVDWSAIADATVGAPSAWVLAHHLAWLLDGDSWTPLSRHVLELALGCGTSGVRAALDRLENGRVLERRAQRGGVSGYRFAARAAGREPVGRVAVSAPAAARVPLPAESAAGVPGMAVDRGVSLTIGGVDLELPPGVRLVVTIGPDGRPRLAIG